MGVLFEAVRCRGMCALAALSAAAQRVEEEAGVGVWLAEFVGGAEGVVGVVPAAASGRSGDTENLHPRCPNTPSLP